MGAGRVSRKIILFGIDGADWAFLNEWIGSGFLPNLATLVKSGVRASLQSVLPLNSASAWVTIITGRSPGAHGIFGFMRNDIKTYKRRPVCPDDIGAAAIWDILNAHGEPIGVINCPITYPPPAVNGFIVSGILIPHNDLWAYPPEVESQLRNLFRPYLVDVTWTSVDEDRPGDLEKFLADIYLMTRKQEEVALKCLTTWPWQALAVFFTGTDRIMHRFWHLTDENHPRHSPDAAKIFKDEIRKYFSLIDDVIGSIIEKNPGVPVIVVSDHGFGPLHRRFYSRKWLEKRGYLVRKKADDSSDVDEALKGINFDMSRAFPASISESGVWINLKGRQQNGIVSTGDYEQLREKIIRELEEYQVEGRERPVKKAIRREETLKGPYIEEAPDILINASETFIIDDGVSDVVVGPSNRETGTHRPAGIFIASGQGFKQGAILPDFYLVDVLPTFLTACNLPVPKDLEGKVIFEAFDRPPDVIYSPPITHKRPTRNGDMLEEDQKRKEQLKGLGYL